MNVKTNAPKQKEINQQIDAYTAQVIAAVPEVIPFNPMTLCVIDNDFVCVTEYEISNELADKLEAAALSLD